MYLMTIKQGGPCHIFKNNHENEARIKLTLNLLNFINGLVHLHFWNYPLSFKGISYWKLENGAAVHYLFFGYQDENLKLVSHQYTAWADCIDV